MRDTLVNPDRHDADSVRRASTRSKQRGTKRQRPTPIPAGDCADPCRAPGAVVGQPADRFRCAERRHGGHRRRRRRIGIRIGVGHVRCRHRPDGRPGHGPAGGRRPGNHHASGRPPRRRPPTSSTRRHRSSSKGRAASPVPEQRRSPRRRHLTSSTSPRRPATAARSARPTRVSASNIATGTHDHRHQPRQRPLRHVHRHPGVLHRRRRPDHVAPTPSPRSPTSPTRRSRSRSRQ